MKFVVRFIDSGWWWNCRTGRYDLTPQSVHSPVAMPGLSIRGGGPKRKKMGILVRMGKIH